MTALQSRRAKLLASLYVTFGEAASWTPVGGGAVQSVTVRRNEEDGEAAFGSSAVLGPQTFIRVRSSEVAEPQRGDLVAIVETGETFKVISDPRRERNGGDWACEVAEVRT